MLKPTVLLFPLLFMLKAWAQPVIQTEVFANGFVQPVDIANAGDSRLFIVERRGIIHVVDSAGNTLPTPFLNIDPIVKSTGGSERGLLGLVFHPQFPDSNYFYVNYINNSNNTNVSRFTVSGNPDVADPNSEVILLTVTQPYSNHNGGDLSFGPDGYLYIGLGDGGNGGDPQNYAQNNLSLLGKMLRIDVDGDSLYAIPPDNPFVGDTTVLDEIWASGLRNPWRFSFDRLTNDIWIADVGQNAVEEIDFQPAASNGGEDYGWRCYEGNNTFNTANCAPAGSFVFPVHTYAHSNFNGCSVTGGYVYRGNDYGPLQGYYIFGDYCSGRIWTLYPDTASGSGFLLLDHGTLMPGFNLSSFGENADGELFMSGLGNGTIYRIKEACNGLSVAGTETNETCPGDADGSIDVTATGGTGSLSYNWSTGSTNEDLSGLASGTFTLTVTDSLNCSVSASFTISAPVIEAPVISSSVPGPYCEGDTVILSSGPAPAGYSYQWYRDSVLLSSDTLQMLAVSDSGAYYVGFTGECEVPLAAEIMINLLPLPAPLITASGDTLSASEGAAFQWYLNGNPLDSSNSATWVSQQSGVYTVEVTDSNGCAGLSPEFLHVQTSLGNEIPGIRITLFPSPATSTLNISIHSDRIGEGSISWYDLSGRRLNGQSLHFNPGDRIISLDVAYLPAGIYFLQITVDGLTYKQKWVK